MTYEYFAGSTMPEGNPTYVGREADDELFQELKEGQFCYVFNARKTGKSSLQVRVMSQLKREGFVAVIIDLSGKGTGLTLEQWYLGILNDIRKELKLEINLSHWYKENNWLSPLDRFREFIETVMLVQISKKIVIFIDEVDSVLRLDFSSGDFFAFIRACYNRRTQDPVYNRLTFCLLGVVTPSALIADHQRTPFNIGQTIELTGLTFESARHPLGQGLVGRVDNPEKVLEEVIKWTRGQPFLTQKICKLIVKHSDSQQPNIEQFVQLHVINNWQSNDTPLHLTTISERITKSNHADRLLGLYQKLLLSSEGMDADDSPEQMELRLSGLVIKREGKLEIYNLIYQAIFNWNWVDQQLANLRRYAEQMKQWEESGCQDESYLLRRQALADALEWRGGKILSTLDDRYLRASQELEQRESQQRIDALEESKSIDRQRIDALEESERVKEENRMLKIEADKAQARRIPLQGCMTIILPLLISFLGLLLLFESSRQKQEQDAWWRQREEDQMEEIEKSFPRRPSPEPLPPCTGGSSIFCK